MSEIDIRGKDKDTVTKIRFADDDSDGASYLYLDADGDIGIDDFVKREHLGNLIKALQYAESIWGDL